MQSPLARHVFHPADDALLNYLTEDGHSIEPEWYIPIIPMVLINGAEGIGTGKPLVLVIITLSYI
jgi:DNA topoisomerase II